MEDINLLPVEEKQATRVEFVKKKLSLISIGLLITTGIFTFVTLGLFTSFANKRAALFSSIEESSATVNSLKANEELMVVVKKKTETANKIINARNDTSKIFEKFSSLVPQDVYFTDLRFTAGKVMVSGKAKTSADASAFVGSLVSSKGAEIISNVSIDSLSANDSGVYSFVISGQLVGN